MYSGTRNIANVTMLSEDISSLVDNHYRRNNRLLCLVGLWPYQNWSDRFLRLLIVNLFFVLGFFFQIFQFYASGFKIDLIVKELQLFVLFVCCSVSYYTAILKFSTGKKIRHRIVLDWEHLSNEKEVIIMRKYASKSEQFTLALMLVFYIFAIILVSPSVLRLLMYVVHLTSDIQSIFPIPVRIYFFFKNHFYLTLICEYFGIWIVTTLGVALYSTFILCITHACGLLSLVTFKINQPFKKDSSDVPHDWSSSEKHDAHEWIREIIKCYENAIEFIDMMNALTEKIYLVEVFFGIFLIIIDFLYSFQMLQSTVLVQNIYELLMSSIYIGGTTFILYLNCYIGQKLMDHGTQILESFYQVSLYELPLKCQKALPLLIMRSTKPSVISIGGIFVASHDFFARFMNTSLSYAMVCYNMR